MACFGQFPMWRGFGRMHDRPDQPAAFQRCQRCGGRFRTQGDLQHAALGWIARIVMHLRKALQGGQHPPVADPRTRALGGGGLPDQPASGGDQ